MRWVLAFVWCGSWAAADMSQLRQLAETNIFELPRALGQPASAGAETLFYRGMIASRFGRESAKERAARADRSSARL